MNVFIDFEAISAPLCWVAGVPMDMPYAYSMKQQDTNNERTFIVDFSKTQKAGVFKVIGDDIRKTLKEWNGGKEIDLINVQFISWYGSLEKKIMKRMFYGEKFRLKDQYSARKTFSASLEMMSFDFTNDIDFKYSETLMVPKILKKVKFAKRKNTFKNSSGEEHLSSGILAAIMGAYLYMSHNNKGAIRRFEIPEFDEQKVISEIANYSLDDVLRMQYIHEREEVMKRRFDFMYESNLNVQNSTKNKSLLVGIDKFFKEWNFENIKELRKQIVHKIENFKPLKEDEDLGPVNAAFVKSLPFNEDDELRKLRSLLIRFDKYRERFEVDDNTTKVQAQERVREMLAEIDANKDKLKEKMKKELTKII